VLMALTLVYTLNFVDRSVITVIAQPIIETFKLTDTQWGLLTGPPFAIFYAVMGIPIAMWADRSNRVFIIAFCVVIWSLMTVFCGLAASFIWLLLFRIGVAIGEAGCTPPANSLITDYYPPRSRASALGIYGMGVTIGGLLAQLFVGLVGKVTGSHYGKLFESVGLGPLFQGVDWASVEGWRMTFIIVGLPGVLIALVFWLSVREPPRGYSEPKGKPAGEKAGFAEAMKEIGSKPTFWTLSLGAALVAFVGIAFRHRSFSVFTG
jgi:MFS family permease